MKYFVFVALISLFAANAFSQVLPRGELVDQITEIRPEDFGVRVSILSAVLEEDPSSVFIAVIHPDQHSLNKAWKAEGYLNGAIAFAAVDRTRFILVRGEQRPEFAVEFWLSKRVTSASLQDTNWNFRLPRGFKPFVIYDLGFEATNSFLGYERIFADFLNANKCAVGQIRVLSKTAADFRRQKSEILRKLGVRSQNRVRFIRVFGEDSARAFEWRIVSC